MNTRREPNLRVTMVLVFVKHLRAVSDAACGKDEPEPAHDHAMSPEAGGDGLGEAERSA